MAGYPPQQGGNPYQQNQYPQQGGYPPQPGAYPPAYPQQGPYQTAYPQQPTTRPGQGMALASFVGGFLCVILGCTIVIPILTFIFGAMALGQGARGKDRGFAITGIALSSTFGLVQSIVFLMSMIKEAGHR